MAIQDQSITEPTGCKYDVHMMDVIVLIRFWFRYASSYAQGSMNIPPYRDYNRRREPFNCNWPATGTGPGPVFYLGRDYTSQINDIRTAGRPTELAAAINDFVSIVVFLLQNESLIQYLAGHASSSGGHFQISQLSEDMA